jgi:hypothetical protein
MVESLWWHMLVGPITKWRSSTAHMRGSALQLFGLFHHFDVIFMVVHSLWLLITNLWNFLWNKISSHESWLGGHLPYKNMILIYFTGLVGLIEMQMGWIGTQVPTRMIPLVTRPQVPCVTQNGSKELALRKWPKTWCRSWLTTLERVEGSCWESRD